MKQVYFLFSICLFLFACNTTQTTTKDHYLPDVLQSVQLGMPMEQVLKLRPKAYVVNSVQNTPRQVYTEDIENDNYQAIDYFFDKTGEKSLVELNIRHTSEEKAEQTIRKHFGESKNHKQNEWQKTLSDGTNIYATWRKKKVFVFIKAAKNSLEKTAVE